MFEINYLPISRDSCNVLRDLVSFVQFKKREAWNLTKSNTPPWVFFELYKWYQIA